LSRQQKVISDNLKERKRNHTRGDNAHVDFKTMSSKMKRQASKEMLGEIEREKSEPHVQKLYVR
jgi:hypothetical protein